MAGDHQRQPGRSSLLAASRVPARAAPLRSGGRSPPRPRAGHTVFGFFRIPVHDEIVLELEHATVA